MRALSSIFLVVVVVAGAASCTAKLPAPRPLGSPFALRGAVTDSNTGGGVIGASVRVSRSRRHAGQPAYTLLTTGVDSLGQFNLKFWELGRFYVTALAIGYCPTTLRVDLPRDSTRFLTLRLAQRVIYVTRSP